MSYTYDMDALLSTRLPRELMRRLRERARERRMTPSRVVREVLARELGGDERDVAAMDLTRKWVGSVRSKVVPAARDAREALEDWNPDRRG